MFRIVVASVLVAFFAAAAIGGLAYTRSSDAVGSISLLYVDTDVSGTTITQIDTDADTQLDAESVTIGPVDECAEIAVGEEITIDIMAADWPVGVNFTGVEVTLNFDPAVVKIATTDDQFSFPVLAEFPLLEADPQSSAVQDWSPNDGRVKAFTFFSKSADEDIDGEASSPGPVARATLKGEGAGQTTISLTTPGAFVLTHPEDGWYIPVDEVRNGFISVGQPCVPGSQPGPAPGPPLPPLCGPGLLDSDGDGYSNCAEQYMGTDWTDACVSGTSFDGVDGWPVDPGRDPGGENGWVNIIDLIEQLRRVHITDERADLDTDGVLTLLDTLHLLDNWNTTCVDTPPIPTSISLLYVDTDISGTTITQIDTDADTQLDAESVTIGPVDECAEIAVGEDIVVDIMAADWPSGLNLTGVEVGLNFDSVVLSTERFNTEYPMLDADPQALGAADATLDDDYLKAFTIPLKSFDEDVDGEASSPGPLARVTFTGEAVGQTTISLTTLGAFVLTHTEDGRYIPVDEVRNGFISVGQPCVPGPQPGPAPGPPASPICAAGLPDADGDGYSNCAELYMGTDWAAACANNLVANDEADDAWPLDFDDNRSDNIIDLHEQLVHAPLERADLDVDGVATLLDTLRMLDQFGTSCVATPPLPCASPPWWSYPPPWQLPVGDDDCDGWSVTDESAIGTDPNDDCADTATANDEADDKWPPDFDDNKTVDIIDVLALKPVFGTPSVRHDLNASGGNIDIIDVLALKPVFGASCP